ncbi:DUF938 domain-containing protein [Methylococcus sp. EFPC2]|uniref:DUF938 domain-containing protein n=1 Tax=Methylococcus sp. EFPC2 TaxID=2812648 RepID=UPI001F0835D0|nr:DUF938 domain-containing protein [Methylococcus sp. EFPC2]
MDILRTYFARCGHVLEIGSGTGQHAVYFAEALSHLAWQCSDRAENLSGIRTWLDEAALPNTPPPIELDVSGAWPGGPYDAIFSANTLHIMHWTEVERFFAGLKSVMASGAKLAIYGPFNYEGRYSSPSNADFDAWLKARDMRQGIRDFEAVADLATGIGLELLEDRAMPANNRALIWQFVRP